MNAQVKDYMDRYPAELFDLFCGLRQLIFDSAPAEPEEVLWAKLPSYYVGRAYVRLIPFQDHINIEASAVLDHKDELAGHKVTPKGMLQIYLGQEIPSGALEAIFVETLGR